MTDTFELPFGPASKKQEMILNSDAQILIIGGAAGSGKSYLLQMMPLQYVDDPNTSCIIFRRTSVMIKGLGGLLDTARQMYGKLPDWMKPKFREHTMEALFPSGAKLKWSHMENSNDRFNHQGLQYTFVG